jgi:hypothetical protein
MTASGHGLPSCAARRTSVAPSAPDHRKIDELFEAAGFRLGELVTGCMSGPKLLTFMYQGSAEA